MQPLRTITFISIFFLFCCSYSIAQQQDSMTWEEFVERMRSEEIVAEDGTGERLAEEEMFEELWELHCNPMNINTATEEDLQMLPFLTEAQVREILVYLKVNGDMLSLGELLAIRSLSAETREYMRLFCRALPKAKTKPTLRNMMRYAEHELTARTDVPFYTKAGYKDIADSILDKSPNKAYRGDRLYHSLRYRLTSMNHLDIGVQMEKDAGERGVDYISAYALLKDIGRVRTAALGNYRVSFGQGLVVNTGTSFGKLMTLNSLARMDRGIYKHSSTSETGYFTGAATTIDISNKLSVSAFYSSRKEDGTLTKDSSGITSLKTDGLHRTPLERSKKGNVTTTTAGGNIHLSLDRFDFSITGAHTHYSRPLRPKYDTEASLYRYFNAQGSDFGAYSIAYSYASPKINFRGETATSTSGGFATVNSIGWQADGNNRLTAIYRNYDERYVAVNGHSFGDNSRPQNEHGLYVGWQSTMIPNTTLDTYVDFVYYPWRKYQVSAASRSVDGMLMLTHRTNKSVSLSARYRFRARQKDFKTDNATLLAYHYTHNARLQCNLSLSKFFSLRTTLTGVVKTAPDHTSKGILLSENLRWADPDKKARAELTVTYFNTDDYDSRISIYEPSLLYSFGFRSLYHHGLRSSLLLSMPIYRTISLCAKVGSTFYFNRNTIGSGLEQTNNNHREDLQVQVRAKF